MTPVYSSNQTYSGTDQSVSIWSLPLWIQLLNVTAMTAAFLGLLRLFPLIQGKIDDLLKNENRHSIMNYINANPGATIAEVSRGENIERATVKYHLYKLEDEGKIVFRRMGKFSRVFRNSHSYSDDEQKIIAYMQNRTARTILLLVLSNPGITNQELAGRLGVEKSAVHWHIDKLLNDGLIRFSQDGKFKRYSVGDNVNVLLRKYADQT